LVFADILFLLAFYLFFTWFLLGFPLFLLRKIFNDSIDADQHPKKFYDERRKIKIEDERKDNQTRACGVEHRVNQRFAFDFFGLQQNIRENDEKNADRTDKIIKCIVHPIVILRFFREMC
jgi:predicted membrane protein